MKSSILVLVKWFLELLFVLLILIAFIERLMLKYIILGKGVLMDKSQSVLSSGQDQPFQVLLVTFLKRQLLMEYFAKLDLVVRAQNFCKEIAKFFV